MNRHIISPSSTIHSDTNEVAQEKTHNGIIEKQFEKYTETMHDKQRLLVRQVEDISARQKNWLQKINISEAERQLVKIYWQEQEVALKSALNTQNRGMKAVGEAQVVFIREVCNSLLTASRASLQYNRSVAFQEQALHLHAILEEKNLAFWDLFEAKITDAENRPPAVQKLIYAQAERMLERWNRQFEKILDDFADLLNNKV